MQTGEHTRSKDSTQCDHVPPVLRRGALLCLGLEAAAFLEALAPADVPAVFLPTAFLSVDFVFVATPGFAFPDASGLVPPADAAPFRPTPLAGSVLLLADPTASPAMIDATDGANSPSMSTCRSALNGLGMFSSDNGVSSMCSPFITRTTKQPLRGRTSGSPGLTLTNVPGALDARQSCSFAAERLNTPHSFDASISTRRADPASERASLASFDGCSYSSAFRFPIVAPIRLLWTRCRLVRPRKTGNGQCLRIDLPVCSSLAAAARRKCCTRSQSSACALNRLR